ncbi:hypothetical protein GPECTOR_2g1497 [Gonium pectorale]|uniref:Pherophorin domain-containing protein n=1 Tax=Gonium pectorale TaxID=33097 RepID=A0A150H1A1_GONPE|nr:hypothetical protein GPECTOR_2g1497 [Gonium pectorale]|eukprot:KXZ55946.1 hypothetical protein GPECTOR_2g1497 [Gonium pectorale]
MAASLRTMYTVAVALMLLYAALPRVNAHAGHFHLCPDTPSGRGYVRYEIGNCTNFVSLNATANLTMTGKVTMWVYAYKNCSDAISSALEFNTVLYSNGAPLATTNTTGYAYTGTCASATKSVYLDDAPLGNTPDNMIFWYPALTTENGSLCGNAANDMIVRTVGANGQLESSPMQSVVLSTAATGPALCCDFSLFAKPAMEAITAQTAPCDVAPPSPPMASSPPRPPPTSSPGAASGLRMSALGITGAALLMAMAFLA